MIPWTADANTVSYEIRTAFRDVPRPKHCVPKNHVAYGEEEELDYLVGKTWLDVAGDVSYMVNHAEIQFLFMTKECLVYLSPGYLLGVVNHDGHWSVARVESSLLRLLYHFLGRGGNYERYS